MAKSLKPEFLSFIKEFKKQPGKYTEDELVTIGIAHQELIRANKDWTALVEVLGVDKSGEQFRKWILAERYKRHLVPKNPKVLDADKIESLTTEDVEESLTQQKQDLMKERMKVRDERTSLNRTLRNEARLERFVQTIQEVAASYRDLPVVIPGTVDIMRPQCEAVYGLADLHLGPIVENYINTYNYDEAVARVHKVAEDIVSYSKLMNTKRINFLNLGDLIAGIIHPTIRLEQEFDVIEQVMRVSELVAELLNCLIQAAPEITYRSVVDNHARITPDKNQHIELENLNRIIDIFVEERLKNTNIKFIKDNIDIGIGHFQLLNGKQFFFMHGHEDRKSSVVQDIMGLTHIFPDYIMMAHYHNAAEHTFQGAKLFITGSVIGSDSYAFGKRLFGQPEQKLLFFDTRNNVIDIDIRCKL